jgi:hypothetical protein
MLIKLDTSCGIPAQYLSFSLKRETWVISDAIDRQKNKTQSFKLEFEYIKWPDNEQESISPKKQRLLFENFITSTLDSEWHLAGTTCPILITCRHTDKVPMLLASFIATHLNIRTQFISHEKKEDPPIFTKDNCKLAIIHGVSGGPNNVTPYRIQAVQDSIVMAQKLECPFIVVAGNVKDPVLFSRDVLNFSPNFWFQPAEVRSL